MAHQKRKSQDFSTPPDLYQMFREDLKILLEREDSPKSRYLLTEFESKLLDPAYSKAPEERRQAAIKKWLATEERNRETDHRIYTDAFEDEWPYRQISIDGPSVDDFFRFCRSLISDLLGPLDYSQLRGSFSNGASTEFKRALGIVGSKYLEGRHITEECIPVFEAINVSEHWKHSLDPYTIVQGNVLFTVPKSVEIDRCAAKEPTLNMYVQKAVGDFIRRRLKRKGVDLNDQSINQELARQGSITGALATVDLSSASDSITTGLVAQLLPPEWFALLMSIRSPLTLVEVDGEKIWHNNAMISSMGNACTFELESLIFWAITRAVCYYSGTKGIVSVYGDDIICPSSIVPTLAEVFGYCGFLLNLGKSFHTGPFRESCGKHYWKGEDISPFYVRKVPRNLLDWTNILNKLRKWLAQGAIVDILDPSYFELWSEYVDLIIPKPIRGGWDYSRRDILVSPGRRPIARLANKQRRLSNRQSDKLQNGLLLQWLDTADRRELNSPPLVTQVIPEEGEEIWIEHEDRYDVFYRPSSDPSDPIVVSELSSNGDICYGRAFKESWSEVIPRFPQEW